jgi:uncharacterized membrane protein
MITLAVTAYLLVGFLYFILRSPDNNFSDHFLVDRGGAIHVVWPIFIVSLLLARITD